MSQTQHIAELNWGYLRAPWGQPEVAGFTDNVDLVNAASDRSKGMLGRIEEDEAPIYELVRNKGHEGPVEALRLAVTFSLWESDADLSHFVHKTIHGQFVKRRAEWFLPQGVPTYVIFPVTAGTRPTLVDGVARLKQLAAEGPSPAAYDFKWMQARLQEGAA